MAPKPFEWTSEVEQEILNRIMSGDSVDKICGTGRDDFLPSKPTFYKHLLDSDAFANEYMRAREAQAHEEADEIRRIADEATGENYHVARLRIDARKWRASKLAPKKYGDKLDVSSSDGTLTPKASFDVSALSTAALKELMALKNAAEPE